MSRDTDSDATSSMRSQLPPKTCVMGVPHCPFCNKMLWPPEKPDNIVNEHGEPLDSVLDATPGRPVFHASCYPKQTENESDTIDDTAKLVSQ